MKIKSITLSRLPNAEHYQLHNEFKRLVEVFTPESLKITVFFARYLLLYAKLDIVYKKIVKSLFTEQIQEADKARDEIWRGLMDAISSALRHFDPAVRAAAKQLDIVRKTYGNVAKMSYNGQTAATTNFIQDLEGPYASHVATLGLGAWLVELKARNITFANLVRDRAYESSLKELTALKKARALLDEEFYAILRHLEALVEVEGLAAYERFILELNVHIDKYNLFATQTSRKPGKKGKKGAEETQTEGGV